MSQSIGKVIQVIGPVVDVSFEESGSEMPEIFDALEITRENGQILVLECQQHIGEHTIRTVAMDSTDGLSRGIHGLCGVIATRLRAAIKMLAIGDKLSNIRAMYRDHLSFGDKLWERFNQKAPKMQAWYYRSIADATTELDQYPAWQEYNMLVAKVFS